MEKRLGTELTSKINKINILNTNTINTNVIIVTGAESTGKTQLANELSSKLKCNCIAELSREFIENLDRSYTYSDVEKIARIQIQQIKENIENSSKLVIFDTGLIITKVWFDIVYNKCPQWLVAAISDMPKVFHLLCDTDIPWVADSVRENGGLMRNKLTLIYKKELDLFGFPYEIVSGINENRLINSLQILKENNFIV